MYTLAVGEVVVGMKRKDPTFLNVFCFRLLATGFEWYERDIFPFTEIADLLFVSCPWSISCMFVGLNL